MFEWMDCPERKSKTEIVGKAIHQFDEPFAMCTCQRLPVCVCVCGQTCEDEDITY